MRCLERRRTAADRQLRPRYCRDPRSDGYGIFLVLWFGADYLGKAPPRGRRPESAGELADRLEAQLAPQHRLKIEVVVIDMSAPPGVGRNRPDESGGTQFTTGKQCPKARVEARVRERMSGQSPGPTPLL